MIYRSSYARSKLGTAPLPNERHNLGALFRP
jgi:hypothetical protein